MVGRCNSTPSTEARGGFTFNFVRCFPECSLDERDQRPLVSGVARIYTKREDSDRRPSFRYHEADLEGEIPCWWCRIVAPRKTTTRKSRCFVHCLVIIVHCLLKTISKQRFLFSKRPVLHSTQNPGLRIILFCRLSGCKNLFETNKIFNYFCGAVERADSTRTTTPKQSVHP